MYNGVGKAALGAIPVFWFPARLKGGGVPEWKPLS